jgi:hypothetical protein
MYDIIVAELHSILNSASGVIYRLVELRTQLENDLNHQNTASGTTSRCILLMQIGQRRNSWSLAWIVSESVDDLDRIGIKCIFS